SHRSKSNQSPHTASEDQKQLQQQRQPVGSFASSRQKREEIRAAYSDDETRRSMERQWAAEDARLERRRAIRLNQNRASEPSKESKRRFEEAEAAYKPAAGGAEDLFRRQRELKMERCLRRLEAELQLARAAEAERQAAEAEK
uniref:DUF2040 domain-containing protein n=1 Tax=Macrostomum lignano TaxID=282301 RepID=A0A1I8GLG8_9PLAT